MVGIMRKRIENSIERVEWRILSPQVAKDVFILVSQNLDLVDTACSVVEDNAGEVQKMLQEGSISKPSLEQVQRWNQQPEKQFHAVIAHPFVFIQEAFDH